MLSSSRLPFWALAALLIAAAASVVIGVRHALAYSQDLQWDEAKLILDGINPYLFHFDRTLPLPEYINPYHLGLTQPPSAVLLFAPLTLSSFETAKVVWIAVNLAATVAFVILSVRLFHPGRLSPFGLVALMLVLIASMPWRITIGNGQYGLVAMALFLASLHFYRKRRLAPATLFLALALVKHTLVLPFCALFLERKRDAAVILAGALLMHLALTVLAGHLVGERPDALMLQSVIAAASIAEAGAYDLFSFLGRVAPELGRIAPAIASALVIALTVAMCWRRVGTRELAALSIVSIIIVYHRSYDAFVLMFVVLHLLTLRTTMAPGASPLDRLELHIGWAVLAYAFLLDQFVYALGGPDIAGAASAVFSALLYGYLLFLFCRSFAARRRGEKAATPEAAIATE